MKEYFENFIAESVPGAKPLLIAIRGSQAYGTALPTSDTDYSGVFIQPLDDILGNRYIEQISDKKGDIVFYEVRRFLELVASNNPNILELLNTPEDCVIYKHDLFDLILEQKEKFITKVCGQSFGGYAIQQIKKAKGQDKKQNWEQSRVSRKDVLDFVYVIEGEKSIPWKTWNQNREFDVSRVGAVKVPNAKDVYSLFYDSGRDRLLGYRGLVKTGEGKNLAESNQLRVSSIPKGQDPIAIVFYNKEGYTEHCVDYRSYQEWLEKRNEQRWVDVESHGQKIDGKNMMHCRRLLEMSKEIGLGQGIQVRRPNPDDLIAIRKGEVDLESLIKRAEEDIQELNRIFQESSLPDKVDPKLIHELIVNIRRSFYF